MYDFKQIEEDVLKFWKDKKIIENIRKRNKNKKKFYFLDGPPYTSGKIHMGTAWNQVLKDQILRYKRMQGFDVWDRGGYDMHGLPTAHKIQTKNKLKDKIDIEKFGVDKFVKQCKEFAIEMMEQMNKDFDRLGVSLDHKNSYMPIKNKYMEGEWWLIKKAHEKNRLYLGKKVMTWCPECETALAKHELEYKNVKDKSIFVKFKIENKKDEYLIVWTTTPWTIAYNLGVMVNPDLEYVKAKVGNEIWILAKELAQSIIEKFTQEKLKVLETIKGKKLEGIKYVHPFYEDLKPVYDKIKKKSEKAFNVVLSKEYVNLSAGTGLVHMAPGCGPEDYEVGRENKIPAFNNIDEKGNYPKEMGIFSNLNAKKDNEKFIEALKKRNALIATSPVEHDYAHCWRCHKPVIFRGTNQWFFKVEDLIPKIIKQSEEIKYIPKEIKDRYQLWLKNLKDNSITRQRYWGTPLPIWKCDSCGNYEVIGSIEELKENSMNFPKTKKIYLMRHGESESNIKHRLATVFEKDKYNLTTKGKNQVKKSVKKLKEKPDLIVTSDFKRTNQTAEIIAKITGAKIITDKRLREISLPSLDGKQISEFAKICPINWKRINNPPKGIESFLSSANRVQETINELTEKYPEKKIMFISHGDPIWSYLWLESGKKEKQIDSIPYPKVAEIKALKISAKINLHRPWIDKIKIKCKCGKLQKRVPDIIDVWVDAGTASWNCLDYPSTKKNFKKYWPADLILEATEQTRLWFYMLQLVSNLAFDENCYKAMYVHGMIRDISGVKMSKSIGNIISPNEVLDQYGVDTMRLYCITNKAGEDMNFSWEEVKLKYRELDVLNNIANYLLNYENNLKKKLPSNLHIEDKWILSRLNSTIEECTKLLDNYQLDTAPKLVEELFLDLSRRYIQFTRGRKEEVFEIVYEVLINILKMISITTPFIAESIYQKLRKKYNLKQESIHFCEWPKSDKKKIDKGLEKEFENIFLVLESGLAERDKIQIGLKWPLAKAIVTSDFSLKKDSLKIISRQLNVKKIEMKKGEKLQVKLDSKLTPELEAEGYAREVSRKIQAFRKNLGLVQTDKVETYVIVDEKFKKILEIQKDFLTERTNSKKLEIVTTDKERFKNKTNFKIKDKKGKIAIVIQKNSN